MRNNGLTEKDFFILSLEEYQTLSRSGRMKLPSRHIHHFRNVRRTSGIRQIFLGNGDGGILPATLREDNTLETTGEELLHAPPPVRIHLAQAMVEKKQMESIIHKMVEAGAATATFFYSDYSQGNHPWQEERVFLWRENAGMQAKSAFLPSIRLSTGNLISVIDELRNNFPAISIFWGDWTEEAHPEKIPLSTDYLFINGPEGGWSNPEKDLLKRNFPPVSFSDNVLKSETAALAGILFARFMADKMPKSEK